MLVLFLLAFLGGLFTIASPCILPVIPLVFSRAGRPAWKETAPLLLGLALAFTAAALIATTTAHWLLTANEAARVAALALLATIGVALIVPEFAAWLTSPVARVGGRLLERVGSGPTTVARNILIGAAVGILWAPCAGPILGLLIAAASKTDALHAASLFLTFALGAITMLAVVLAFGARALTFIRRFGATDHVVRRTLGVATLITVVALALGWDQALFGKGGIVNTAQAENLLIAKIAPSQVSDAATLPSAADFLRAVTPIRLDAADGMLPSLGGGTEWINSLPLTAESLRGKVVLVDFWTFACYNCLNALPHVKALEAKYRDKGLVVIGVHTPELARERVLDNVRREVKRLGITYPVVVDNDYTIWRAFNNQYWPAAYYADATGKLRFSHFGEGSYDEQDRAVAKLLEEAAAAKKAK